MQTEKQPMPGEAPPAYSGPPSAPTQTGYDAPVPTQPIVYPTPPPAQQSAYAAPPPAQQNMYAAPPPAQQNMYAAPPPTQMVYAQPPVVMQPAAPTVINTTVVTGQTGPGNCPCCHMGNIKEDFTCCGICCCVFFFPIGIICCLMMQERHCNHCGQGFN